MVRIGRMPIDLLPVGRSRGAVQRASVPRTTRAAASDRARTGLNCRVLIAFNKPFGVACKFSPEPAARPWRITSICATVYPAGRLDTDSEGLVLLTDDGALQARITEPKHKLAKGYWAQVDGAVTCAALEQLRAGVNLGDFVTQPASAELREEPPGLWPRDPPIRYRAQIPTTWIELTLHEGRNRQVRRMTAKVGFPTLRLIRAAIGAVRVEELAPGGVAAHRDHRTMGRLTSDSGGPARARRITPA